MWMNLKYIPTTKWATLCAVFTYITTIITTMGGIMTMFHQKMNTMVLLLMLIMHAGTDMKKITKYYILFTAPMASNDFSQKMKSPKCLDIYQTIIS